MSFLYKKSTAMEYIWIDNKNRLRSKTRTLEDWDSEVEIPIWNFDGSSTGQAPNDYSEVILYPQKAIKNPFMAESLLVLCDCYDKKGVPNKYNSRYGAKQIFDKAKEHQSWFGMEQEYVIYDPKTSRPLGWPKNGFPEAQGKYYCSVGFGRAFGRAIVEEHYTKCIQAKLNISGFNAEVMPAQWEFQIGPCEGVDAGDQMWLARYILERVAEKHNVVISYNPKPEPGDWNGSGFHVNYSTNKMRETDGIKHIYSAIEKLKNRHSEHIKVYGDNSRRLTGKHETSNIDKFTYGVGDRTASIRIPYLVETNKCGYLEDRRPASDCDPYLVTSKIVETVFF